VCTGSDKIRAVARVRVKVMIRATARVGCRPVARVRIEVGLRVRKHGALPAYAHPHHHCIPTQTL